MTEPSTGKTEPPTAKTEPLTAKVERHPAIQRLYDRRERHQKRSRPVRWAVALLGALITLVGVVMTGPVPGPGFVIIPFGLALLALEFVWAERLFAKAVLWADRAKEQASNRSRGQKIASVVVTVLAIAGFITAVILWDVPLLPDN